MIMKQAVTHKGQGSLLQLLGFTLMATSSPVLTCLPNLTLENRPCIQSPNHGGAKNKINVEFVRNLMLEIERSVWKSCRKDLAVQCLERS